MLYVDEILYRRISPSDFKNIEGAIKHETGNGQTYIDLSGVKPDRIVEFFTYANSKKKISSSGASLEEWPEFHVDLIPLGGHDPTQIKVDLRRPGNYKIAEQSKNRHPAWSPSAGFPTIFQEDGRLEPGQFYSSEEVDPVAKPLISDLSIYIVRTRNHRYFAGFLNGKSLPESWPSGVGLEELLAQRWNEKKDKGICVPNCMLQFTNDKEMPFSMADVQGYGAKDFLNEVYVEESDYEEMTSLLRRKKNLILQGAPGTGKTFSAKRLAYALMGAKDDSCIQSVQFHQSSSYEDYVVGYRPNSKGGFNPVPGVFLEFCNEARSRSSEDFFLLIDEINRANISKVFGEMLTMIEADHRNDELTIPGLTEKASVPANLFIIGMMNTADRGLALVDYALRRRFAFFTMKPALNNPRFIEDVEKKNCDSLTRLVESVKAINEEIASDQSLGEGFCIGHSYFTGEASISDSDVRSIARYELMPLIKEYWFDESDKGKRGQAIELLEKAYK